MDAFPEDFNEGIAREILAGKRASDDEAQEALLKQTRERIYNLVKSQFGSTEILIAMPDTLATPQVKRLGRELFNRFPGALWRRVVIHYGDVDEFRKVTREEDAVSFELKLIF